jgi:hypothetical protein
MVTMLRGAAAAILGMGLTGMACAGSTMGSALDVADWERPTALVVADAAVKGGFDPASDKLGVTNPVVLVSGCVPACAASNCCDDLYGSCVGCGDACDCGSACDDANAWYASAGVILLKRDRPAPGTVVAANPGGTPFSSASDFSFDWEPGVDVALARRFAGGTIVEGRYFGVDSTDTNAFVTPGGFIGAGFTGPAGTSFNGKYLSKLNSSEINLRRALNDRLSVLGGFRWIELKDEMFYKLNGNVATGDYEYNNRLYGGQVGASLNLARPARRFMANIEGKAGAYANVADGGIFEYQGNNFIGSFTDRGTTMAFAGELDLTVGYRLTPHIVLTGGYQFLWLGDVALAGEAASRSLLNPSLLRSLRYQDLFYQGAMSSIAFVW